MQTVNSKKLTKNSQTLRTNMTDEEVCLWKKLSQGQLGYRFRRQHIVEPYILDFYCPSAKLAVEIDGGQHADNLQDKKRDEFLISNGITVLRFWNHEVLENTDGVVLQIALSLNPSPQGEREISGT